MIHWVNVFMCAIGWATFLACMGTAILFGLAHRAARRGKLPQS